MNRVFTFLFLLLCGPWSCQIFAQVTFRLGALPARYTPAMDTLFLAGNFNNWNPRDPAYRFIRQPNSSLELVLNSTLPSLEYKVTRGSWARVEVAATGADIPNRQSPNQPGAVVTVSPADWADTRGNHTATNSVQVLTSQLWLPSLQRFRRIWVCLPASYEADPQQRFPVLYFHDGQNVFDAATSFSGEWRVDEALAQLENQAGWQPLIAVGIDNGGSERLRELTPFRHPTYGGGEAENYSQDVVETVKPLIDQLFRTKPEAENTGIGGSSLGGVASLYMAYRYPEIFSKALIFSPSLWFSDSLRQYCLSRSAPVNSRLYWLCGTAEGDPDMVPDMNAAYSDLQAAGMTQGSMLKTVVTGGTHSEAFWSSQVREGIRWLFGGITGLDKKKERAIRISRRNGGLHYENPGLPGEYRLLDLLGRELQSGKLEMGSGFISIPGSQGWLEVREKGVVLDRLKF